METGSASEQARHAARVAGLTYVSDVKAPGFARRGRPGHFWYEGPDGKAVRARAALKRIKALAIPPAWKEVWIASRPTAHIQATGRDAQGRKQYRYHPAFCAVRDADKFAHLAAFARQLPALRAQLKKDLRRRGLPREKILATIVMLLEATLIRVGNEDYARQNRSYGLTTLRNRHVRIRGDNVRFIFLGKSGKRWNLTLRDRRIANVMRSCQELPGQHLFEYRDEDGLIHSISSTDVNAYLREAMGADVTAKEFRTWAGTVAAAMAFGSHEGAPTKRSVRQVISMVADQLGNTAAVCRKCYVHPIVIDAFLNGALDLKGRSGARGRAERWVLRLLRKSK